MFIDSDNLLIQELWDGGLLDDQLSSLPNLSTGSTINVPTVYQKGWFEL